MKNIITAVVLAASLAYAGPADKNTGDAARAQRQADALKHLTDQLAQRVDTATNAVMDAKTPCDTAIAKARLDELTFEQKALKEYVAAIK